MADAEITISLKNNTKGAANKIVKTLDNIGDAANSAGKQIKFFNTRTADFVKGLVGFNVIESVFRRVGVEINDLILRMIGVNSSTELYLTTLETLTGSQEKANKTFEELQEFARVTPFLLGTVMNAYIKMKAQGLDPTIERMTILGDTTSALGGAPDIFDGISRALGQIQTKGRVQTEELLQLAERGVPVFDILKEKLNLTGEELQNIGRAGVSTGDVLDAIFEGLGERFSGQMALVRDTFAGTTSELKSLFEEFLILVGAEGSYDKIKNELQELRDIIIQAFETGEIREFASDVNMLFEALVAVSKVIMFIAGIFAVTAKAILDFGGALSRIGEIGRGMITQTEAFKIATEAVSGFLDALGILVLRSGAIWDSVVAGVSLAVAAIKDILSKAGTEIFEFGKSLMQNFADGIISAANVVIDAVESILARVRALLPSSPAKEGPLSDLDKVGPGLVRTISSGVDNSSPQLVKSITSMSGSMRSGLGDSPVGSQGGSSSVSTTNVAPVFNVTVNAGSGSSQGHAEQIDAQLASLWVNNRSKLRQAMQ